MARSNFVKAIDHTPKFYKEFVNRSKTLLKLLGMDVVSTIQKSFRGSPSKPGRPPGVKTGNLRSNIQMKITGNKLSIGIGSRAKYGFYLESGTGLYGPRRSYIYPKRAKALVFRIGAKLIFAKRVKGIKPRPFLNPAFEKVRKKWIKVKTIRW